MHSERIDISGICVTATNTVRETIACIDHNHRGVALVVDSGGMLESTITDGDVRRAFLAGITLDAPLSALLSARGEYIRPLTARENSGTEDLIEIMRANSVRHVPIVDESGRPVDLVCIDDLLPEPAPELRALIMAGGSGQRLRPLTVDTPKPMLPVGGKPLLEHILGQLREHGVQRTQISTFYRREKIQEYFQNGSDIGIDINYIEEHQPLGTGGALRMVPDDWTEPLLVMNGDILTRLSFRDMATFHREQDAVLTMAVRRYEFEIPYGVVESEGPAVRAVREKPRQAYFVNAGVYLISPAAREYFPCEARFDMTDLIAALLAAGRRVVSFPIHEYWLDIGQHVDYEQAQKDSKMGLFQR